jgi:hypothetical protein
MKPPYTPLLKPGTIYSVKGFKGFWKITSIHTHMFGQSRPGYDVIKCTKSGKEFSGQNGFAAQFIDTTAEIVGEQAAQVKVIRSERSKLLRKRTWLTKKLAYFQAELTDVENTINGVYSTTKATL